MEQPDFLHSANAEELANISEETGAEVLRGPLRYPSETGSWQLGDLDLSERLSKYRNCEVILVIATTSKAKEESIVCGICGFVLTEAEECPRCKLMCEENARRIKARQQETTAMFREVESILGDEGV